MDQENTQIIKDLIEDRKLNMVLLQNILEVIDEQVNKGDIKNFSKHDREFRFTLGQMR